MNIPKPSITRLARKAGVKTLADDCYPVLNHIIERKLKEILDHSIQLNSLRDIRTLMLVDIENSLKFGGEYVSHSQYMGNATVLK